MKVVQLEAKRFLRPYPRIAKSRSGIEAAMTSLTRRSEVGIRQANALL
jgi:hypothetical protein